MGIHRKPAIKPPGLGAKWPCVVTMMHTSQEGAMVTGLLKLTRTQLWAATALIT